MDTGELLVGGGGGGMVTLQWTVAMETGISSSPMGHLVNMQTLHYVTYQMVGLGPVRAC